MKKILLILVLVLLLFSVNAQVDTYEVLAADVISCDGRFVFDSSCPGGEIYCLEDCLNNGTVSYIRATTSVPVQVTLGWFKSGVRNPTVNASFTLNRFYNITRFNISFSNSLLGTRSFSNISLFGVDSDDNLHLLKFIDNNVNHLTCNAEAAVSNMFEHDVTNVGSFEDYFIQIYTKECSQAGFFVSDNYQLSLFEDTPNQFPELNFTTDKEVYCLLNNSVQVNLNISSFDFENNTILYALNSFDEEIIKDIFFSKEEDFFFGLNQIVKNYNGYDIITETGMCGFDVPNSNPINLSTHFLSFFNRNDSIYKYQMRVNGLCIDGVTKVNPELIIDTQSISSPFIIETKINEFRIDDFGVNISLYNTEFDRFINLFLERNATGINFYKYNETNTTEFLFLYPNANFIFNGTFFMRLTDDDGLLIFNITADINKSNNVFFQSDIISDNNLKYIGFTTSSTFLIEFIKITDFSSFNFTTIKPTDITFFTPGVKPISLFYTDNIHTPITKKEFRHINIFTSQFCIDNGLSNEVGTNLFEFDDQGKTGVSLFFSQFIYLIQFPFRLGVFFNILEVLKIGLLLTFTLVFISGFFKIPIEESIFYNFTIFWILYFMKLTFIAVPVTLTLLVALYLSKNFLGNDSGSDIE